MNIAVTATGGGVGQGILKALSQTEYKNSLVALDGEPLGAGLYMTDKRFVIPYASSPDHISKLMDICLRENVGILFPGMDVELYKLAINKSMFREHGIDVIISDNRVINIADDKLATANFLLENDLPHLITHPLVSLVTGYDKMKFPVIIKPRKGGARSRGVYKINGRNELDDIIHKVDIVNYVAQEYVEGDEYTCGTITLSNGYVGCIVMRRILRDGDTYKAFVERNDKIEALCENVCGILQPFGAFNIQLRLKNGVPYVFEFNARCSGTTNARALAGFNEPRMVVDYLPPPVNNILISYH